MTIEEPKVYSVIKLKELVDWLNVQHNEACSMFNQALHDGTPELLHNANGRELAYRTVLTFLENRK